MTSIGLRPALLFFSFTGVNTAASISARKLSNGTTRAIISSGSTFAVIAASRRSASKNPNCPIVPTPANLVVSQIRLAQIRGSRYFSRCPEVILHEPLLDQVWLRERAPDLFRRKRYLPFDNDGERFGRSIGHWSILLSRSSSWSNRLCQKPVICLVQSISGAKAPSCAL